MVEKFDLFRTPRPKKFFVLQITYVTGFDNCRTGLVLIFFGQLAHSIRQKYFIKKIYSQRRDNEGGVVDHCVGIQWNSRINNYQHRS